MTCGLSRHYLPGRSKDISYRQSSRNPNAPQWECAGSFCVVIIAGDCVFAHVLKVHMCVHVHQLRMHIFPQYPREYASSGRCVSISMKEREREEGKERVREREQRKCWYNMEKVLVRGWPEFRWGESIPCLFTSQLPWQPASFLY